MYAIPLLAGLLLAAEPLPADARLTHLSRDAHELKDAFNAAKGNVRMILIVSPG